MTESGPLTREVMREAGLTADEAISMYKQGAVRREFPSQFLKSTIDEIEATAASRDLAARRAIKLLFDRRFDK